MSTYERLRLATDAVALSNGISEPSAAMWVMTVEIMKLAESLPHELRQALVDVCQHWYVPSQATASLEAWRVRCWQFLEAKNGNSSSVVDRSDVAVRGLICVLWDSEPSFEDVDPTLEYLGSLLDIDKV